MQASFLLLDLIFLDESYAPALLVTKARRLRHETGNWALHARHEEWDVSVKEMVHKYLLTPFRLLATPICFLMALYASFCYGILYLRVIPWEEEDPISSNHCPDVSARSLSYLVKHEVGVL